MRCDSFSFRISMINVRVEKILPVHRQEGLNLCVSLICSNENKKLLRNL